MVGLINKIYDNTLKIVIASKEVLKDNKTVHPFVADEMLKYADQVHTLKYEPKDVVYLTNTQN